MNVSFLRERVERFLKEHDMLIPDFRSEVIQKAYERITKDLHERKTTYPAEAICHNLRTDLMIYAGVLLGKIHPINNFQYFLGLVHPTVLLDQSFAALSMGMANVYREFDNVRRTTDDSRLVWQYDEIKDSLAEAVRQLRADPRGITVLRRFVDAQIAKQDVGRSEGLYFCAGMVAAELVHGAFILELAAEGYSSPPFIIGGA